MPHRSRVFKTRVLKSKIEERTTELKKEPMIYDEEQTWRRTNDLTTKRGMIWRRRTEEEQIWLGDWTILFWSTWRTQKIVRKKKWNTSEVVDERRREFSAANEMCLSPLMGLPMGFLMSVLVSADGFVCLGVRVFWSLHRWWCLRLSQVGICMFGCESILSNLRLSPPMGFADGICMFWSGRRSILSQIEF